MIDINFVKYVIECKLIQAASSDDDHERKKLRMEIDAFRRIVEEAKNGYQADRRKLVNWRKRQAL